MTIYQTKYDSNKAIIQRCIKYDYDIGRFSVFSNFGNHLMFTLKNVNRAINLDTRIFFYKKP